MQEVTLNKILIVLVLLLLVFSATAFGENQQPTVDLSEYSVESLLDLRIQIEKELIQKGYNPYFDLERGDSGESVLKMQEKLALLGYFSGMFNGKFDAETQRALKRFEKAYDLKNDGQASKEDQLVLFEAEVIRQASPTPATTATPDPMQEIYAQYVEVDYTEIMRHPENFYMKKVTFKGRVVQVLGNRSEGFQVRLATSGSDNVVYVFINEDPGYNIIENDSLTVYGRMQDTITYESVFKVKITIPAMNADYIVLR